ncbi:MerR family transcriptional regulator [Reichenbachiella agarivorans]|uniref:MerR family transcriptional regulator n=1 Tax=Reichenbachiella agarivorans TaxID=2979464 RepID=A0ABY6CP32_9BACT|nr:MerR family transcriptional regulator [Reichenbachiella agarivorans]UXP32134.1 MerR family transcriptional regulator [Reichenbachiella agarivorans]
MGNYSIKELERLSGIKAHTIRIWEKRYQLIEPSRSDTNIRSYNDGQLKKILNVSSLVALGYKISKISQMNPDEITSILEENQRSILEDNNTDVTIHQLIKHAIDFNEKELDDLINQIISQSSLVDAFTEILFPVLNRIGFLWTANKITPAHEHFMSHKVKQLLYASMSVGKNTESTDLKYLLFLPQWEEHEILLLFCNYLLKKNGMTTIYLGSRVPLENLIETIKDTQPIALVSILTTPNYISEFKKYQKKITQTNPEIKSILGGAEVYKTQLSQLPNVTWVDNTPEFLSLINV